MTNLNTTVYSLSPERQLYSTVSIATVRHEFAANSGTMFALRRTMATMAAQGSPFKQAGKVVCIGRNYA